MKSSLRENMDVIETLANAVGLFHGPTYKVRQSVSVQDTSPSRVMLFRKIPESVNASSLRFASAAYASLTDSPNILTHFGLIQIEDGDNLPPGLYAASDYVRGITLKERIERVAPFRFTSALHIAITITEALITAEAQMVEHGALAPESIIITSDNQVKVADFQLGAAIMAQLGTPYPKLTPARAVAALLYEMLSGEKPNLALNQPFLLSTAGYDTPQAIDGIIQKGSTPSSLATYSSLSALLGDLKAANEDLLAGKSLDWSPVAGSTMAALPVLDKVVEPQILEQIVPIKISEPDEKIKYIDGENETDEVNNTMRRSKKEEYVDVDEDDDYEAPPRRSKVATIFGYLFNILAFLFVAGLIVACAYLGIQLTGVPADVTVPNLIGKQYDDAQKIAVSDHFVLNQNIHDYSDSMPKGAIFNQDPIAGRSIKAGKTVDVSVSDGPRLTLVPDLSQMTLKKAQAVISDSGLPVGAITYEFSDIYPKNIVTAQTPAATSKVSRDTAINLTVSKGSSPPIPPANVTATTTIAGEIDLAWDDSPGGSTYNVSRDGKRIASALPQTTFSDVNLNPGDSHTYTVTAVNANGESDPSKPVVAAAQPGVQPTLPDPNATSSTDNQNPDSTTDSETTDSAGGPRQRAFHLRFRVPRGSAGSHDVQIQVQDTTGSNVVYDEQLYRGDIVDDTVTGFGNKVIIRIFIDKKLIRQTTK